MLFQPLRFCVYSFIFQPDHHLAQWRRTGSRRRTAGPSFRSGRSCVMRAGSDVLPREKLLNQAIYEGVEKDDAARVLDSAESSLKTWGVVATEFLTPPVYQTMEKVLKPLVDLKVRSWGGYEEAERRRLFISREGMDVKEDLAAGVLALDIGGRFLFDPAEHRDFLGAILASGVVRGKIGDILTQGERGAHVLVHPDVAAFLAASLTSVRTVTVKTSPIPLSELKVRRAIKKAVTSVEASLRLDAVGSAGIGVSRSKLGDLIKGGQVLVNWRETKSTSAEVKAGDTITVRGKGRVEVLAVSETKSGRFRVDMNRIA
ncbi:unnamed protein product [Phaeothamnion confervicola]